MMRQLRPSLVLLTLVGVLVGACTGASSAPWQSEDQLNAVDGQTWIVGDHLATVSPNATQIGTAAVGSKVRVSGRRTPRGELVIDAIEVIDAASTQVTTPTPSPAQRLVPTPPRAPAPQKKPERGHGD